MDIGERLREAREEKNITLESLQETTKIQKRYLVAIEEGNFDILPGKFYARAFIKEYALAVGLNPAELLAEFSGEVPSSETSNTEQYSRMQRSRRTDNASKGPAILSVIPAIIVALLVIGIIFVAITLYQKSMADKHPEDEEEHGQNEVIRNPDIEEEPSDNEENLDDNNNEDINDSNNEVQDEPEPDLNEPSLTLVDTGSGQKPESTFELVYTGETVTLTFEPTGESWLDVINGNSETIYQGMTVENEPIEVDVTGQDRIRLNIGYAPALLQINLNDVELEYPVDPNKFVNQRIWIEINKESE